MKHIIFVYGTLKEGFGNHHLLEGAYFVGHGVTLRKYSLYVSGIPFVFKGEAVSHIYGELYKVGGLTLKRTDHLEGHPEWYRRDEIQVVTEEGRNLTAWLYFYPEKRGKLVKTGRYE